MKHTDGIRNLESNEAVKKLQELIKHNSICFFGTMESANLNTRPMAVQEVDDDGNFWFLSGKESQKNKDVEMNSTVQLFFANPGDSEFLSVLGIAAISSDRQRISELWKPIAKAWFTKGKDDPSITVIKVTPADCYYWDTKHGKMVSLIKFAAGALSGERVNEGVQGTLNP